MSVVKKFVSDTMIYGLSTIISRMLGFLITPFLTRSFGASVYGIFTQMFAYASMLNAILAFGMETTFFRYLQKVEGDKRKVFDTSFFVTLFMAILFLITAFVFADPLARWAGNGKDLRDFTAYVKLIALIVTADAIAVIPFSKLRADGRPIRYGLIKLINILVYITFIFLFLYGIPWLQDYSESFKSWSLIWYREGWLGNIFVANLIASAATLFLLIPQVITFRMQVDTALLKNMLTYSFPILIANISFIINENLDKMMMPHLLPEGKGDLDVGIYGAVAKLAIFLNLFVTAFRLGAEPFFFSYAKNENARKTYAMIMEYFVIVMLLVMVGLSANLEWLKEFIRGTKEKQAEFWSGLFIVPLLLFNYVLLGIYMNLSVWYKLSDQTRYGLYISGLGAIATIGMNLLLIPKYSYVGAVVSTTITYVLMVSLSYFWGQKNYAIPYKVGKICVYLVIGAGLAWLVYELNIWLGNLVFIGFIGIVAYLEKDTIRRVLRR
ncbi:lipopolysaccharide biosynthesis protein [Sphingobacterium sp. 1.A.4]|uniref:lipopolysaccharide biosynthesis protein n=1 Tax=Sphingobacterium sp. 1.A.4 TaxID=2044603 RepID=UPI00211DE8FB|nr:polysaccharide biosynthesis C-terminal domain-containing protein [Sphingobacterium sp. 1.A.4]